MIIRTQSSTLSSIINIIRNLPLCIANDNDKHQLLYINKPALTFSQIIFKDSFQSRWVNTLSLIGKKKLKLYDEDIYKIYNKLTTCI